MNWGLIAWIFGTVATLYGIKFIFVLFRTLFSKETMVKAIDVAGQSASNAGNRVSDYLQQKVEMQKERRRREKEKNKPVVIIR